MNQVIGRCSICGGEVVGFVGAWWGTCPPPAAKCSRCGAVEARGPVIPMIPNEWSWVRTTYNYGDCGCPQNHVCNNVACPRSTNTTAKAAP